VGPDGGTHQAVEDIALMRVIPRMCVISPCDSIQAKAATLALGANPQLAYLRLAREKTPVITTDETPFEIGKAQILYRPHGLAHITFVVTGSLVGHTLRAAHILERKGVKALVVNMHTIKPLDTETLLSAAKETKAILTIEEHQIIGGLGGAVAETLSKLLPTLVDYIGMYDQFGQSGTPSELIEHYDMGIDAIITKALALIERK
jgi:transketolase